MQDFLNGQIQSDVLLYSVLRILQKLALPEPNHDQPQPPQPDLRQALPVDLVDLFQLPDFNLWVSELSTILRVPREKVFGEPCAHWQGCYDG